MPMEILYANLYVQEFPVLIDYTYRNLLCI
jgi:hypothetical protein